MIKKIKNWIIHRFLPVAAREMLETDNKRLQEEVRRCHEESEQLKAYIGGLETGMKAQRRIIINTGEGNK